MLQIHHTCNLKVDKTQLPQDFALFYTFFAEYCIRSGEDAKTSCMQPKSGQNLTAPPFSILFFAKDCIGSGEDTKTSYMQPENGQNSTAPRFCTFLYFFFAKDCIASGEDTKMSYMQPKN